MIPLVWNSQWGKTTGTGRVSDSQGARTKCEGVEGHFWGWWICSDHDRSGGDKAAHICYHSSNRALTMGEFTTCKFHLAKSVTNTDIEKNRYIKKEGAV